MRFKSHGRAELEGREQHPFPRATEVKNVFPCLPPMLSGAGGWATLFMEFIQNYNSCHAPLPPPLHLYRCYFMRLKKAHLGAGGLGTGFQSEILRETNAETMERWSFKVCFGISLRGGRSKWGGDG